MTPPEPAAAPPDFSRSISVSQTGGNGGITLIVIVTTLCMAGVALPASALLEESSGWVMVAGTLAAVMLAMVLVVLGMGLVFWLETLWRRWRALAPLFHETTQVDIGAAGLAVKGLGHVAWGDVLAIEAIPDSESALIVHTRPFEKLLLQAPTDELAAVISHYMDLQAAQPALATVGLARCRAVVFYWPFFFGWICAGYALAGALGVALLVFGPDAGFFKNLLAFGLLLPMTAWLVWAIPFAQLGVFEPGRVRAFELQGARLRSSDGVWEFDLDQARATYQRRAGIGYTLEFISVRPRRGRGIDILIDGADGRALADAIFKRDA